MKPRILLVILLLLPLIRAERTLDLFVRPESSTSLVHRGSVLLTGLEPSNRAAARFEEASKDVEQPTSGLIVAVLKDEETGEEWTSRVKACATTKPEQAVIHIDSEGQVYHFDFYLECKAKSSKVRTNFTVLRPAEGARPRYHRLEEVEKEEEKKKAEKEGTFFQKYWIYIVPMVVLLLVSGGGDEQPAGAGGGRPAGGGGGGGGGGGARR
ncbi:hypothetical protein HDU93_002211 [Gonapodya sp. JEL0774]|nr:hypothetical protein HDU93_002211 [Gonapodya sp. JEL0774]